MILQLVQQDPDKDGVLCGFAGVKDVLGVQSPNSAREFGGV